MSPPFSATQFSWTPLSSRVNAAPEVPQEKSTSWIKGALIYSLLHYHLSHTWQGKGGEKKKRKGMRN